ncbi:MAG: type IV-A pilus assembly ATPase PilB [Candidatus Edwardsbacteria bacterium]
MLQQAKLITQEQLNKALEEQKRSGAKLGSTLVQLGYITEEQIIEFLGKQFGVPTINLSKCEIESSVLKLVSPEIAQRFQVLPISRVGRILTLAMANPSDVFTIDDIKFFTGLEVKPVVSAEGAIVKAIEKYYGASASLNEAIKAIETEEMEVIEKKEEEKDASTLAAEVESAPVVKLVSTLIGDAVKRGASDIHIEPYEKVLRVRFRVDGVLQEAMSPPIRIAGAVVSRIKIMAKLNIAERRLPQDGRITVKVGGKTVDLRVSTLPTIHGEKIVMRILEQTGLTYDLTKLGFVEKALADFTTAISKPNGIILVTGPTGSGKTKTLYSAISKINSPQVNIVTAEDPVEYDLMGINQVMVKEDIGYTFSAALRAFLRQDPNIILVGEIRDKETAEIAMKAAMTGHLVLSTLHTNDAASSINRMIDMGTEPYMIAFTVNLIQAQRLVRTICPYCKESVKVDSSELLKFGVDPASFANVTLYRGKGCLECNKTGYKGRIGIFEVMSITPSIRQMIMKRATNDEIQRKAQEEGMLTLREDGLLKVKQGITTLEEITRVTVAE